MPWKSGNFTDSCAKVVVLLTANIINTVAMKVKNNFFILYDTFLASIYENEYTKLNVDFIIRRKK